VLRRPASSTPSTSSRGGYPLACECLGGVRDGAGDRRPATILVLGVRSHFARAPSTTVPSPVLAFSAEMAKHLMASPCSDHFCQAP
jgi:hypothetical protein